MAGSSDFKNAEIFEIWKNEDTTEAKKAAIFNYVMTKLGKENMCEDDILIVKGKCDRITQNFADRWRKSSRNEASFKLKNKAWLEADTNMLPEGMSQSSIPVGRPRLTFEMKSERSKRREASKLSQEKEHEVGLILHAAKIAARKKGQTDIAEVIKESEKSPTRAAKIRKIIKSPAKMPVRYTSEEALALILDNNFSKRQYLNIRKGGKKRNSDIYPAYENILQCKKECRVSGLTITDKIAYVPLQGLLDKTASRVLQLKNSDMLELLSLGNEGSDIAAEFIFSYGFDGSTGHSNYKQHYLEPSTSQDADSSLFATTVIPLRLVASTGIILWENKTPHSVRFCRPLKLEYAKESKELILQEKEGLDNEIKSLNIFTVNLMSGKTLRIEYKLFLTLIDGKVLNILTGTKSSQLCPICGASPSVFLKCSDFKSKTFDPKPNSLNHGISPLHCWIRFFECIIHISYRNTIKKWQVRGESVVICVICLSCKLPLDLNKFEEFCFESGRIFLRNYPWFPMPATIHKVLIHGKQILENYALPVGFLSEEASESRNKYYKQDRLSHARKTTRKDNLYDVFNRAMDTSDPLISTLSLETRLRDTKMLAFPAAVVSLLLVPDCNQDKTEAHSSALQDESFSDISFDEEQDIFENLASIEYLDSLELDSIEEYES